MVLADIQSRLNSFSEQLTSQTYLNTFKPQSRDSLLSDGLGTRANSIWKMAQYIVAFYDKTNEPIDKYLAGWDTLNRNYRNQYLIIEVTKGNWQMYDAYGLLMGGNDFIESFLNKKQAQAKLLECFKPSKDTPLQQIYFGAPGTSKSTTIKRIVGNACQHRITFHPDTDYSNFVGCYKPTKEDDSKEITYKFIPQVFIKAYVDAWVKLTDNAEYLNKPRKEVFLIIEEINRGNCAQIFGDLFQLLDRDENGFSDFTIETDSDLSRFLSEEAFKDTNVPEEIASGEIMQLPPNLFIWATMNTSDQSLFPIDSAFKRRWEWKYLPIKNDQRDHIIRADKDHTYDWWEFLEAVNKRIEKLTELEDKQLGYWFAKPNEGVEISCDRFVSKVVFYLWNDVFKDYGNDGGSPFVIKQGDDKREKLKFTSFFAPDGSTLPEVVVKFIEAMGVENLELREKPANPSAESSTEPEQPAGEVSDETPAYVDPSPVQPETANEPEYDGDDDDDKDNDGENEDLFNKLYNK